MEIEFDPNKNRLNLEKHGISLTSAHDFDWDTAHFEEDLRFIYTERRFEATGWLGDRLHVLVYCNRGLAARIINLRRANAREAKAYANQD